MRLVVRRQHHRALLHHKVYVLELCAELSQAERYAIIEHGLGGIPLYQQMEVAQRGKGLLGLIFAIRFRFRNLTVRGRDLVSGTRITSSNVREILAIEDHLRDAARDFNLLLSAVIGYESEEIVEL
jgi:hypothetical protein